MGRAAPLDLKERKVLQPAPHRTGNAGVPSSYEESRSRFDREMEERRLTAGREARRDFAFGAAVVGVTIVAIVGLAFGLNWLMDRAPGATKARLVCDAAVRTLLETRDPLELQRADLLIRRLRCDARRSLPDAPPS